MERDFIEQKVINEKTYTLIQPTRKDNDFSLLMDHFTWRREIVKALGWAISDNAYRTWFFILNDEKKPIACGSLERKPNSKVITMKNSWVEERERGQGLYNWLFAVRLQYIETVAGVKKISSTATEKSKHTHDRYGFCFIRMRGKYYTYWKEI